LYEGEAQQAAAQGRHFRDAHREECLLPPAVLDRQEASGPTERLPSSLPIRTIGGGAQASGYTGRRPE